MKLNKKSFKPLRITVALLLAIVLLLPIIPQKASAAGNGPRFNGVGMASTKLHHGESCHLKGTVNSVSGYNLNYVEAVVYNAYTNRRVKSSGQYNIGKASYTLRSSKVDNELPFGKLEDGDYYLVFYAQDTKGNYSQSGRTSFHVGSNLWISNLDVSNHTMKQGCSYNVLGTITCDYKITTVHYRIERYVGDSVYQKLQVHTDYHPNTTSVDIKYSPINYDLKFGSLPVSSGRSHYTVVVEAWDEYGTHYIAESPMFYVY